MYVVTFVEPSLPGAPRIRAVPPQFLEYYLARRDLMQRREAFHPGLRDSLEVRYGDPTQDIWPQYPWEPELRKAIEAQLRMDPDNRSTAIANSFENFFLFADGGLKLSGVAVELFDEGKLSDDDMNFLFNTQAGVTLFMEMRRSISQTFYDEVQRVHRIEA